MSTIFDLSRHEYCVFLIFSQVYCNINQHIPAVNIYVMGPKNNLFLSLVYYEKQGVYYDIK